MSSMLCEFVMIGREELMEGSKRRTQCIHIHTTHSQTSKRGMYVCLYELECAKEKAIDMSCGGGGA